MTVYEQQLTTFWTVDTPLNDQEYDPFQYEPEIVIDEYDFPPDPMQRRMLMIVAFVVVGAMLFAGLVMPRLAQATATTAESRPAQGAPPAAGACWTMLHCPQDNWANLPPRGGCCSGPKSPLKR